MNVLADGASVAVTIPAGAVLKLRGVGSVTFNTGPARGQFYGVQGQSVVGPFQSSQAALVTGATGLRYAVFNGTAPVQAVGAYVADPEDDGASLEFTTTATLTIRAGLTTAVPGWAATVIPSGTTSIASDGVALLNGATTTLTRAAASNAAFAVMARGSASDSFVVSGS